MGKTPSFEVIAGTYEEFLVGYLYSSKEKKLVQSFAAHDHAASIRTIAFSDNFLASGGADDRILIYDLKTRKQIQTLTHHDATINCLEFTENHSHIISGSADGVLAIVRLGNWQVEKIWEKAHKGTAILDVAVHHSGKLALTLGADCTLCTWNLIKGRQAYTINLRSKCKDARSLEKILWNEDGVRFVLYGGKWTELWSIETGGFLKQIEHKEKVTCCVWLDENSLISGHENGDVTLIDLESEMKSFKAHKSRVKAIKLFKKRIVTCSSDGVIKIWNKSFDELSSIATGCRITCLCIVPLVQVKEEPEEEPAPEIQTETPKITMKAQVIQEDEGESQKRKKSGKSGGRKKKLK